jgi:hypothetical protein
MINRYDLESDMNLKDMPSLRDQLIFSREGIYCQSFVRLILVVMIKEHY